MKKIVCVYNLSKEHEQVIESLLAKQNITIVKLNEKLLNQKIGAVAQLPDFPYEDRPLAESDCDEELLLFANLSDAEVDQFADELKKHFRFSGVMAMLTEHNRNWYFIDFFDEVMKDHRLFKAIDELREEMKNCESADPSKVENLKKLNDTLMEAFLYLKAQDYEEKRLLALSSELRRLRGAAI